MKEAGYSQKNYRVFEYPESKQLGESNEHKKLNKMTYICKCGKYLVKRKSIEPEVTLQT